MRTTYEAQIDWLLPEEGGRKFLPEGDMYAPIVSLSERIRESEDCWSIFVRNVLEIESRITLARISYLSAHAPNNLSEGVKFYLFEGGRLVATGRVLREVI